MKELKLGFLILQIRSTNTEAVALKCSVKIMLLNVPQNSQESTYAGVSL